MIYPFTDGNNTSKRLIRSIKLLAAVMVTIFSVLPDNVSATHIVGGDLAYRCLGNNLYEIRLTLRRDCFLGDPNAQFDDPASIGFFNAETNQLLTFVGINGQLLMPFNDDDTLNQEFISDCTISGFDVCVQQTTYVDTITLPFLEDGYILSYMRCCRNNSIQNIEEPVGTGMTLVTIISDDAQLTCNSSPTLGPYPPIYVCVDQPIDFDFSVENDQEGDSAFYFLFSPFVGGSITFPQPQPPLPPPYDTVVYPNPFSLGDIFGNPDDPLRIDPVTGRLQGTPTITGQFIAGVRIFTFDTTGTLIEATSREWQYNVRACRDVPEAEYSVDAELNCDGLSLSFTNDSEGELDILWIFDVGNPDSDTSTAEDVNYSWTEPGFYDVALIVTDPDSVCFDTLVGQVGVFESELSAEFNVDVVDCGTDSIVVQITDQSIEPDLNFEVAGWEWILTQGGDTLDIDTVQNPLFIVDSSLADVNLTLVAFSENGCSASTTSVFDLNVIEIPFQTAGIDSIGVCDGDTVSLFPFPGNPAFEYIWDPTDGLDISEPFDPQAFPTETTEYFVTVTDGLCAVGGEVVVVVQDTPMLDFVAETNCRDLQVDLTNTSVGGILFEWDFGDGSPPSFEENPTHVYEEPGNYVITLSSADGCDVVTGAVVTVAAISDSLDVAEVSCFAAPIELNPDADESLYTYEWSPVEGLSDATAGNPTAEVDVTTQFNVTITDIINPGCFVVDSINIVIPPDFALQTPADTSYCGSPEITLSAGNTSLDYTWTDIGGNVLSEESDLVVQPTDTTSYILTGADMFGCTKTDTVTLFPTFFAYEVSPDVIICQGDDTTIFVNNLDPNQDLSYTWMPEDCIVGPTDISNPTVNPEADKVFTVQIMNNTLGCMVEEQVEVLVSEFDYEISGDATICLGEDLNLQVTNNDTTVLDFLWSPTESIVEGEDGPSPIVMPTETTEYTVQILNTDYGCLTSDSVVVNVSWFTPDFLEIFTSPDTIFANSGEFFELFTNQDDDLTFIWTGEGIVDASLPVIEAAPEEEGEYQYAVTVINDDGCEISGMIANSLTVLDPACDMTDVFIPTAFSPNGDGQNDELRVFSNFIMSMELVIYNRWGQEVFRTTDQDLPWNGEFEGESLPPDVYGYHLTVMCPPNKEFVSSGNITLLR